MRKLKRAHDVLTPCPVCGAMPEPNSRGQVHTDWLDSYGHRRPDGEPCRGMDPIRIQRSAKPPHARKYAQS